MVKIRIQGTREANEQAQKFLEACERRGEIKILSVSDPYANRGNSKYERVYAEIEINHPQTGGHNRLLDLLIEFDEMGYAPTTPCGDPERCAKEWKNRVREAVNTLEAENAALRERLEKAVELPVKVGGKVYMPWEWDGVSGVAELTVNYISLFEGELLVDTDLKSDDIGYIGKYSFGQFRDYDFGVKVFAAHEAAEARLEELKGEKS